MTTSARHVLTIVPSLGPGGVERVAQNCAIWYARSGMTSTLFAYEAGGVRERLLRDAGARVVVSDLSTREAGLAAAMSQVPDVVHIHRPGSADPVWSEILTGIRRLASPKRVGIVETSHFARADRSPEGAMIDVHLHLSRWCLWKWRSWATGILPEPIGLVVPHMVMPEAFHPLAVEDRLRVRQEHGIPGDAFVFGRIGQGSMAKWSPIILDAFAKFAPLRPNAHMVLVCSPQEFRPLIEALPKPIRDRITLIPLVLGDDKLRECYGAFDVFLHAAQIGETFGMVLCESMLCGVPVITRSMPEKDNGQLEVVGHERGGLVVYSIDDMVQAMTRLMDDGEERIRLGRQGREWVLEQYSPARIGDMLNRIVECVAASESRDRLRESLARAGLMPAPVTRAEINRLMLAAIGSPSLKQRLLMSLVHSPTVYAAYRAVKSVKTRMLGY